MRFKIGDKLVFRSQGPCRIDAVVKKAIAGQFSRFYRLSLLDNSGDVVFVPFDKLKPPLIRSLITKAELPKLLSNLESSPLASTNWRQRALDQAKLLVSGSAFDLAEIVESLTELSEGRALLSGDRQTLEKAKRLLICEISEVTGETRIATEEQIDRVLGGQKENQPNSTVTRFGHGRLESKTAKKTAHCRLMRSV